MLDALPQIFSFFQSMVTKYWDVMVASSVLAGFLALAILDKMFHIFDIIRK